MCLSPITISNPNYSRQQVALTGEGIRYLDPCLSSNKAMIDVPCGKCVECRNTYYNSILQRSIVESLTSYVYFVTLTYDNAHIPSLSLPNGKTVYYSDYADIQNLFKRFRRHKVLDRDFRYLVALEYGDKRHRPHAHLLLFVARLSTDDRTTPYNIERLLFDNIKRYYAVNLGTRKNPIYQPLFTYRRRYTPQGVKTNYFVKYVDQDLPEYASVITDTLITVKTIRYLVSYVNKGSSFDDTILLYLRDINDPYLYLKLSSLLRSKLRYSKGFGLGFNNGLKVQQSRTFVKCSFVSALYNADYPPTFAQFVDSYPNIIHDINTFLTDLDTHFKPHDNLRYALSIMQQDDLYIYVVLLRYFPYFITYLYKRYFRLLSNNNISFFFKFLDPYKYVLPSVNPHSIEDSFVYKYIRQGIEQGFMSRVPFIAFPLYSSNSFMPLCQFYKERYSDDTDISTLYSILGVSNFDEWQTLFEKYVTNSKSNYPSGSKVTHEQEILPQYVEKSQNNVKNLYDYLFVKKN